MPKATINTLSQISDGLSVTSVYCEDGLIKENLSKEVGVFSKYATKKPFSASAIKDAGIER